MSLSVAFLRVYFAFFILPFPTRLTAVALYVLACSLYITLIVRRKRLPIFLVDYGCYKPPENCRAPFSAYLEHCKLMKNKFNHKSIEFQEKILARSGMSQLTALPRAFHELPPRITLDNERAECEAVLFGALDELLASFDVKPHEIGVIVTNCSVFSPTPSMTTMIVNKYKLPVDVKSFNLSGMGCSAGLLALDLAKRVLIAHPNKYALVLSTENLTRSLYYGNHRPMLVTNCLFRVGGSAVLLSNKWKDRKFSKYRILHTARSQMGALDMCYTSVYQEEDSNGTIGVSLSKDLMHSAGLALQHNMKLLGPKILPINEIFLYIVNSFMIKLSPKSQIKPYIPNFKLACDNICIHAGGKAVVRAMEQALKLPFELSEPSHMTLYRFGNLSSASVWYELAYEESKGRVKKGNRVWQIGLGSGFKCCSSYLKALKNIDIRSTSQCWADCIADMPVEVSADDDAHH
ncbi:hypothetical protein L7F22_025445 [Adiantum nelumboides]|nr:hypothetical protein [Adiantum nelumboides]